MKKPIHTEAQETFCDMLRVERKRADLTQSELAKKLRCPQSFVAKVEVGERRLDVLEFLEYATAVGFDPRVFIGRLTRRVLR